MNFVNCIAGFNPACSGTARKPRIKSLFFALSLFFTLILLVFWSLSTFAPLTYLALTILSYLATAIRTALWIWETVNLGRYSRSWRVIRPWAFFHSPRIDLAGQLHNQSDPPSKAILMLAGNRQKTYVRALCINPFIESCRLASVIWPTTRLRFQRISTRVLYNKQPLSYLRAPFLSRVCPQLLAWFCMMPMA